MSALAFESLVTALRDPHRAPLLHTASRPWSGAGLLGSALDGLTRDLAAEVVAQQPTATADSLRQLLAVLGRGGVALLLPGTEPALIQQQLLAAHAGPHRRALPGAATVLCTSGSGGTRKLVVHGLDAHLSSARGALAALRLAPGDVWLASLPLWHVSGLGPFFRCALAGATLALPKTGEALAAAVIRVKPSHLSVVDTQLVRLLDDARATATLAGAKLVLAGGGPIPVAARRRALAAGIPLAVSYGMTETCALVTLETAPAQVLATQSAGHVLDYRRVDTAADGEILVGGPVLLDGYLTAEGMHDPRGPGAWFATGDLGTLDHDGRLQVKGRKDAMFVSGGENVHPEEIERALLAIEGVAEAIVVPIADPEFGARPAAFVRLHGTPATTRAMLESQLRGSLARFKVPARFFAMPTSVAAVKRSRAELQALAADGVPWGEL